MDASYSKVIQHTLHPFYAHLPCQKAQNKLVFEQEETLKMEYFKITERIYLSFNDFYLDTIPSGGTMHHFRFVFNYAFHGICELMTRGNNFVYLKSGQILLSKEQPDNQVFFPNGNYAGFEIYVLKEPLPQAAWIDEAIEIIEKRFLTEHHTFISNKLDLLQHPIALLRTQFEKDHQDLPLIQLAVLSILRILASDDIHLPYQTASAFTSTQVQIAKRTAALLTENLSQRIAIKTIADTFHISETTLKNYFRGVYGKNISTYLRDRRIEQAKQFLEQKNHSILEIANQVGYQNQSKFAAVFQKETGYTPKEYRSLCKG